jgi:EAL domain-containing protein (putative c-di-GMP-specific phosphodiesterase class I)
LLFLKEQFHCDAQGFYFTEPVPAETLIALLRRDRWL